MKFTKKPTTIDEQIEILKSRGVIIDLPNATNLLLLLTITDFVVMVCFLKNLIAKKSG